MEWMLPVNEMLSDQITKLNCTLIPPGFHGDVRSVRVMIESLCKLIDNLGEQSAKAQGLNKVITTAEKLRYSPTNILYLLKDTKAKNGKGDVIGLLKVGQKHLFLFDEKDQVREVEPLCVLDFFVLPDRQRHGYGRVLFDYMLHDLETSPLGLAIDGPSPKMEQFLCKNYGIDRLVRQNNNFAISPQFFSKVPEINKSGRSTPVVTPAVGRFAAPKPPSAIANVIHGDHLQETNGFVMSATKDFYDRLKIRETPDSGSPNAQPETEMEAINQPEQVPQDLSKPKEEFKEATVEELVENQKSPERPSTLKVEPMVEAPPPEPSPAGSTASRRDSQLTDRGYFDVKFYHNKLW